MSCNDTLCWEKIAPGVSKSTTQISRIVRTLPNAENISIHGSEVRWFWQDAIENNAIYLQESQVNNVSIAIPCDMTAKDVVDAYGVPEALNGGEAGFPESPYIAINLFYPTQGLTFKIRSPYQHNINLQPTARVERVNVFVPAMSLENWKLSLGYDIELHAWVGYGEYSFYDFDEVP